MLKATEMVALTKALAVVIKEHVSDCVKSFTARLDGFETALKSLPAPAKGEPGERGKDGEPGAHGDKGDPGANGKDADPEQIAAAVAKAIEVLPKPADGADGKDGLNAFEIAVSLGFEGTVHDWMKSLDGKPGEPGSSVTPDQVLPELRLELQKAIAAIPVPKDGTNGKDSMVTVEDFRGLFETESTKALLDFERRAQDVLLKAISNIPVPKDGKDGADGLGFDDLVAEFDGERTLTLKFARGDVRKDFTVRFNHPIYRGIYKAGETYAEGDSVTFGGSQFIAMRDTDSKPETDDSWRLSVKRGRDGRDGDRGPKGDPGPSGKNGKDLTQLGASGEKW